MANRLYFRKIPYKNNISDISPTYPGQDELIKLKSCNKYLGKDEKVSCLIDTAFKNAYYEFM